MRSAFQEGSQLQHGHVGAETALAEGPRWKRAALYEFAAVSRSAVVHKHLSRDTWTVCLLLMPADQYLSLPYVPCPGVPTAAVMQRLLGTLAMLLDGWISSFEKPLAASLIAVSPGRQAGAVYKALSTAVGESLTEYTKLHGPCTRMVTSVNLAVRHGLKGQQRGIPRH